MGNLTFNRFLFSISATGSVGLFQMFQFELRLDHELDEVADRNLAPPEIRAAWMMWSDLLSGALLVMLGIVFTQGRLKLPTRRRMRSRAVVDPDDVVGPST